MLIYAMLILAYVSLVMRFLGDWLKELSDHSKTAYAFASLALIIGQGVVLEVVTTLLLKLVKRNTE